MSRLHFSTVLVAACLAVLCITASAEQTQVDGTEKGRAALGGSSRTSSSNRGSSTTRVSSSKRGSGSNKPVSTAATQQSVAPKYGLAVGCTPPTLAKKEPEGVLIQSLPSNKKPNFIIILTDDQGYDDIGLHQPQKPGSKPTWVHTPNIDKFIKQSTEFDNFYVAPMCSQSRASLLTGRDFPRTGTMLVNGGYDYINRDEMTSAEFFARNGYDTAHFGKWHNGRTLGYEPWEVGFEESWLPSSHVHLDNLMRHNGKYVQTKGLMEQDLMDKILGYLQDHESNEKPFYMYYAPHAIHQGFIRPGQGPRWQRPAPEPYKSKYKNMLPRLPSDTAEVWAMLEYMDDVLGRLFDYMESSPLRDNTYIMIMSDNGAELFPTERKGKDKLRRMPSGMQGFKKSVEEGGVRNWLVVKGPGVQAGVTDSTLLSITDVLPTMATLAGLQTAAHPQWDGTSFENLLATGSNRAPATALRGQALSDQLQQDRFIFSFGPQCWSPDMVPELGPGRKVLKPQTLLDYDKGGVDGRGFQRCIGIRWKDYKWLGETGKVYKFEGTSRIELPCNEVSGAEKEEVASKLSKVARSYFNSLVSDEHSFQKPTFYLGLKDWAVTNVLPDGAHERTPGRVELLPNGLSGFSRVGDRACFALDILKAGSYKVQVMYTSQVQASFKMSVGSFDSIVSGDAVNLKIRLPSARNMKTADMGNLDLPMSNGGQTEACLEMIATSAPGVPVFENLSNIRFTRNMGRRAWGGFVDHGVDAERSVIKPANKPSSSGSGKPSSAAHRSEAAGDTKKVSSANLPDKLQPTYDVDWLAQDSIIDTWEEVQHGDVHSNLNATAAMKQVEHDAVRDAALRAQVSKAKESMALSAKSMTAADKQQLQLHALRQKYGWVDGQDCFKGGVCESLFTPYESEGIYTCAACQPEV